jgi:CHAT domain-containing protein/Tfp pilus assembly protein PilF
MKLVYCLFLYTCSLLLLYCISQTSGYFPGPIIQEYKLANRYYDEALKYSFNDDKEAKLNRLALEKYRSVLRHLPSNSTSDTIRLFSSVRAGELESYFDSTDQALYYYKQALAMQSRTFFLPDTIFFKPYLFTGVIYYQQSQTDTAINYFKKAEALQNRYKNSLQESERLYNMLGAVYYESGNYYQARNYFLKAAEVLPKSHPFYKGLYVNYNINLATVLFKLEAYDSAYRIFQRLLPYRIYQNEIYNNIGLISLHTNASKKAIEYFRKVKYKNILQVGLFNDIASAYFNLGDYKVAEHYLDLAISNNSLFYKNNSNKDLGRSFKLKGDIEKESGHYNEALRYFQHSLNQLYSSFTDTLVNSVPSSFSGVFSYIDLFNTLLAKAEVWQLQYEQTDNISYAKEELATYQSAFALLSYIERTYDSDEARLFLGKVRYEIHSKPMELACELHARTGNPKLLEDLYYFDQQNKASVLSFNQEFSQVAQHTNLPILREVQDLKRRITALSIKANDIKDSTRLATIGLSIRNLEIQLGKKQEELAKRLPLPGTTAVSLKSLQSEILDKETTLLSYTLSNDNLVRIEITKDSFNCYQQKLPPNFKQQVETYITSLASLAGAFSEQISQQIYRLLIGDINQNTIKHLVIIPDNELVYLPFETLVNGTGRYLIEEYSVQYKYSTSVLKTSGISLKHHQTTAFAPFALAGQGSFDQLPNSFSEIKSLKGDKFVDSFATKYNFLKHLHDHPILHLATHAVVDNAKDNFSYIAFSGKDSIESRLYSSEIYNLPLQNTDLVILSACETGAGNLIKGEGVMSLSRAFTYAGCPNIVTSLWKADDFSTSYITTRLHQYLDEGLPIDKALQQAKLDYLNDKSINPRAKQPYYWSHLVFLGDLSKEQSHPWTWIVISIVFILSALILVLIKRPRKYGTRSS